MAKRMLYIAQCEGMTAQDAALKELATQANQDLRLALGQLQMWRLRRSAIRCVGGRAAAWSGVAVGASS